MSQFEKSETVFYQFSILASELQRKIWQFAVPDPGDIQFDVDGHNGWISGIIGSSTGMLGACQQSRYEALSVYEPILCTEDLGYLYMMRKKRELDPNILSRVNLINITLGCREIESPDQDFMYLEFFMNWPPEKNELYASLYYKRGNSEHWAKRCQRLIPRRLWLHLGIDGRRFLKNGRRPQRAFPSSVPVEWPSLPVPPLRQSLSRSGSRSSKAGPSTRITKSRKQ